MRGLADSGIVHVQVVANRPHDDFAGIEPHACLHLQAVGTAYLFSGSSPQSKALAVSEVAVITDADVQTEVFS
jgi:hypothetical protein